MKLKEETWKSHFLAFRSSLYRRILCNTGLTHHTRSSALHEKMRVSSGYGRIKWFHMSPGTSLTAEALKQTASPHTQNVPEEHETASSSGSPLSCRWGGWRDWDQLGEDLGLMKEQEGRIDERKEILAFRSCFILPSTQGLRYQTKKLTLRR